MKDRPAPSAHPWRKYLEAEICARPPNRGVQAENAQSRDRRAGSQRARQVQSVQGSDGFAGERPPGAIQDFLVQLQEVPASARLRQRPAAIDDVALPQRLRHLSPDQHPVCLDKGENGCENLGCPGKELPHHVALRLTQQPSEDGARLSVESHRLPRSAASRSAEVCDRSSRGRRG